MQSPATMIKNRQKLKLLVLVILVHMIMGAQGFSQITKTDTVFSDSLHLMRQSEYNASGELLRSTCFYQGKKHGQSISINRNGQIHIKESGSYENGFKQGLWKTFRKVEGKWLVIEEYIYVTGIVQAISCYDLKGVLRYQRECNIPAGTCIYETRRKSLTGIDEPANPMTDDLGVAENADLIAFEALLVSSTALIRASRSSQHAVRLQAQSEASTGQRALS
jgi:hypothetical protein